MATSLRSELQNARMEAAAQLSVLGVEFHSSASSSRQLCACSAQQLSVLGIERTSSKHAGTRSLEEQVSGSSRRSSKASNVCCNHRWISSGIGFLQFASASSQ